MSYKKYIFCSIVVIGIVILSGIQSLIYFKKSLLSYSTFHSIQVLDRNGQELRTILSQRESISQWVALEEISPYLVNATLIAEDRRFYRHIGIDFFAIGRAMFQNLKAKKVVSGGSTLTQQLVRIIRKYPRTFSCKTIEAIESILLETVTPKQEILEHYLNRAPYGNQSYGIYAASQLYFNKPPAHLSLSEAALLAGLPQSPSRLNPYRHYAKINTRKKWILEELFNGGFINKEEYDQALEETSTLISKEKRFKAPHFTDWVTANMTTDQNVVRTTLDLYIQEEIEDLTQTYVKNLNHSNITNASVVVIDNRSKEIIAMVGSVDFFDDEHDGQVNGSLAPRLPGSTWKPFMYGIALEQGIPASRIIPDLPVHAKTEGGDFTPRNYDEKFHGPVRLRVALACSYNIPAVRILEEIGTDVFLHRLRSLGFSFLTKPAHYYGLGLTLGGAEASLLQLVCAYATLANNGILVEPEIFLRNDVAIINQEKNHIYSPEIAALLTDILSDTNARAPAFGPISSLTLPFDCAAKTGTSKNYRDSWTIGYTRDYTVGVWMGNFDGSSTNRITGSTGAAPLFRNIMFCLHKGRWPENFNEPVNLVKAHICPKSGLSVNETCPATIQEIFLPGTILQETCNIHQMIKVDSRNGLIARKDCDPMYIRKEIYEVYPSIYRIWCVESHIPLPPVTLSSLGYKESLKDTIPINNEINDDLWISYPDNEDVFVIDPILRKEYQAIKLIPNVPLGVSTIWWIVDGEMYEECKAPFSTTWTIKNGKHIFKIRARINGKIKESPPISITIL